MRGNQDISVSQTSTQHVLTWPRLPGNSDFLLFVLFQEGTLDQSTGTGAVVESLYVPLPFRSSSREGHGVGVLGEAL